MSKIRLFSDDTLWDVANLLRKGGIVILPTDTVYGLVCHPDFPEALDRIRQLKGRDKNKPFQLLAASVEDVWKDNAIQTSQSLRLSQFWPGALTLVLPTHDGRIEGYRVPMGHELVKLLKLCGGYLRATSVNLSGESPANSVEDIPTQIAKEVDLILDGGELSTNEASTVLQVTEGDTIKVLRVGKNVDELLSLNVQSNQ